MLEDHPYLTIYLLGCLMTAILVFFKIILIFTINWLTKANVGMANIRRLYPPKKASIWARSAKFLRTISLEIPLSWINVLVVSWQILSLLLHSIRESISSTPEIIKRLRFPLNTNSRMSIESVWAYYFALNIHTANLPAVDGKTLAQELADIASDHPNFNKQAALRQLETLETVQPAVIASVAAELEEENRVLGMIEKK